MERKKFIKMDDININRLKTIIQTANNILVTSHMRPDGDAIGSVLGLGLSLQDAGKEIQMVLVDGVPNTFHHLTGYDQISDRLTDEFDISVVLDCSDIQRVGHIFKNNKTPTVNIDHHKTNLHFAKINIVNQKVPSTAEMLYQLIPLIGLSIQKSTAEALLTGIITDTLGFRTSNMQPNTMRVVADLMEMGCDLPFLYQKALINRSYEAVKFWGVGLATLKKEERLAWATLTQEDRKAVGYPGNDDADLINLLSSLEEIDIAMIFVEQKNGKVKVSWRARKGFDVSKIAAEFGGGGHQPAAGAEINGTLEFVTEKVLNETRNYFKYKK
jgi:phosphoesterase RecJ-like protein